MGSKKKRGALEKTNLARGLKKGRRLGDPLRGRKKTVRPFFGRLGEEKGLFCIKGTSKCA